MPRCNTCQFDSPLGMKFCGQCGKDLANDCPNCQFENPVAFKFCGQCGHSLSDNVDNKPSQPVETAERRQLTVMFCDLANSALLSDLLDPEEFRDIIRLYQDRCTQVIAEYNGYVAQYLGDGILVYFGYPKAHENDAKHAVYSALKTVKAIEQLNQELSLGNFELNIRIGIHTGLVVTSEVGAGQRTEHLALGRTPNIAARLQSLAGPNQIYISTSTHHLVKSFFKTQAQGSQTLKGISAPIEIFQVTHEANHSHPLDDTLFSDQKCPSIVGREIELQQMQTLWTQACAGDGQICLLLGEAGVGKSRFIQAFLESTQQQAIDFHHLVSYTSAYHESSSLHTLIKMLERVLDITNEMAHAQRFAILESHLRNLKLDLQYYIPAFSSLLKLPLSDEYKALELSPESKKKHIYDVFLKYVLELSQHKPLIFIVEDLHWADPSSLAFLELLIHQVPKQRILAVMSSRPRISIPWQNLSTVSPIHLNHLSQTEIESLVHQLTRDTELPPKIIKEIIEKTDGIPLFVEELTRMVLDSQQNNDQTNNRQQNFDQLTIPSSLQDLLTARLDSLGNAKDAAQLAAVIGREFGYELLEELCDKKENLPQHIKSIVDAELIFQSGAGRQSRYIFKHALIQETAVFTMLRSRRQEIHRKIATIVENQYPEIRQTMPEYIALHYTRAGDFQHAVKWWKNAGEYALKHSANMEAIHHAEQGLFLLESLPDNKENKQTELSLRAIAGAAYCATTGYASQEVERTYNRAWELCQQAEHSPERFSILWGLWAYHVVRANLSQALEIGEEMLQHSIPLKEDNLLLEAYFALGLTHYFLANFDKAESYLRCAIELDLPERDRAFTFKTGQDAGVCARVYLALTLWIQGDPPAALKMAEQSIQLARDLKHPFSLAYALNFSGWLAYMLRDADLAEEYTEEEISISEVQDFFWVSLGSVVAGWAESVNQDPHCGLERLRTGLHHYRQAGARLSQTLLLSIQAATLLKMNQHEACRAVLDEAISATHDTKEAFWLADIYRLYAKLAYALGKEKNAQNYFNKAINIAKKQNAHMLQLRATASLAHCSTGEIKNQATKELANLCQEICYEGEFLDFENVQTLLDQHIA